LLIDGRVEIDSNGVENLIRPIALNHKNSLLQAVLKAVPPRVALPQSLRLARSMGSNLLPISRQHWQRSPMVTPKPASTILLLWKYAPSSWKSS